MRFFTILVVAIFIFTGCATKEPPKDKVVAKAITKESVRPIRKLQNYDFSSIITTDPKDDPEFFKALEESKQYYSKKSIQESTFIYDDQNYTGKEMFKSLELFEKIAKESVDYGQFIKNISENFDIYETKNEKGYALITGYYAPMLKGSPVKSEKYSVPLYPVPENLISVNLQKFSNSLPKKELIGRLDGNELVPFYSREEIENGALKDTKPIMYVQNKIDAFFLELQGSGTIEDDDGHAYHIGYANRNGRAYNSIGNLFWKENLIDSDKINMQTMREYILKHPESESKILNTNESYVFFRLKDRAEIIGNLGLPLTAKESVAMDSNLIPKASLVFIKLAIPYKKAPTDTAVPRSQRKEMEKFFLVQDTGGAIKGGGRVDIYFGEGDEAFFYAGQTASRGLVYLIVAKKNTIAEKNGKINTFNR